MPAAQQPKRKRQAPAAPASSSLPKPKVSSKPIELELLSDDEEINLPDADSDDEQPPSGDENEDEEDPDEFPEIDADLSADEAEEEEKEEDEADDESVELTDSQAGEEEEEEGYNSSDIDAWDSDAEDARADEFAARSDASQTSIEEELNKMVKRATVKPDESGASTNRLGIDTRTAAKAFGDDRNPDGSARAVFRRSSITGEMKRVYPEIQADYDSDSSTEEAPNRIGNVPLEWYDDMPHIGYDVNGRKVMRPATKDELDKFLATVDGDGEAWLSAKDELMGKDVRLTDEELDIIRRLQNAEIPDDAYDPYEDTVEWFTGDGMEMITPLTSRPEPKRRFVPSKWEHKKVMKIVRAIRQGRITPNAPKASKPDFYNIWSDADTERADHPMHMPAPKLPLPGHAESYNPPAEYLFNEEETEEWKQAEQEDRKTSFLPAKHDALRLVPGYENLVKERFERCLDLYLAPRMRRERIDLTDPESLVPKLPSPKELRPFPALTSIVFSHPEGVRVRCLSVDPKGLWLVTGANDGRVRLWDLTVGRCTATWDITEGQAKSEKGPVYSVEWCPNKAHGLLAASTSGRITLIAPPQCSPTSLTASASPSFTYATSAYQPSEVPISANDAAKAAPVKWTRPNDSERKRGVAVHLTLTSENASTPKSLAWHSKGDYFVSVCPDSGAGSNAVLIHQVSRHRSQAPFKRASKGSAVQRAIFHPTKPLLLVATQRYVRMYDLMAQGLVKTLLTGFRWISSLDIHASGDHVLVGSYDKKMAWFDLDLSNRPFKVMRYHTRAIRSVRYHARYPLFVSASDDGTAQVFHGTVYSDLDKSPLIVPLKVLRGHELNDGLGILETRWHPNQPWLFTAGADGDARLWTP